MSKVHRVQSGEGVSSLAARYGFAPETIWDHPENAALREERRDGNVLRPGDEVFIPDRSPEAVTVAVDACHRFRRRGVPPELRIRFLHHGQPDASRPYALFAEGQLIKEGATDGDGWVKSFVPANAKHGELVFGSPRPETMALRFGALEPGDDLRGFEQRLANLGLLRRPVQGRFDEALEDAILAFQRREELPVSGELDPATRDALTQIHDDPT